MNAERRVPVRHETLVGGVFPFALACAAGLVLVACSSPGIVVDASRLLISNVTVVSPERDAPYGPVDVAVEAGRIVAMGRALPRDGIAPANIVDGAGRFLAPGLIDSHVHLSTTPGMHDGLVRQFPGIAQTAREHIPRSYLYHGVTSVVDLISDAASVAEWNARAVRPHAYFCAGAPIMDGYPTQRIPVDVRYKAVPNFLFDPTRPGQFPAHLDPADHSPAAVVARIADDGAACVKTFWEDGFGPSRDIPVPPRAVLEGLVAAAHARGLPVIMHANAENAQAAGVEAGVDAFAHGLWTWDSDDAPHLTNRIKAILDGIIARGIAVQPSIQVLYGERDLFDPEFLARADVRAAVPQEVLDWYGSPDGQWLTDEMRATPFVAELVAAGRWQELDEAPIRHVTQALTYLAGQGGRLLLGSDTPSAPTYANPTGLNTRLEMDRWVAAGVSAREVFRAATLANAEFFNVADEVGTVDVGKRADLLLLRADPTTSVEAFDTIEVVFQAGQPLPREELAAHEMR